MVHVCIAWLGILAHLCTRHLGERGDAGWLRTASGVPTVAALNASLDGVRVGLVEQNRSRANPCKSDHGGLCRSRCLEVHLPATS